jgi:hypothetical protein
MIIGKGNANFHMDKEFYATGRQSGIPAKQFVDMRTESKMLKAFNLLNSIIQSLITIYVLLLH